MQYICANALRQGLLRRLIGELWSLVRPTVGHPKLIVLTSGQAAWRVRGGLNISNHI